MASIPGVRFHITGASGSQGLLGPKASWRAYILPRGGYASQDSTGTLITFDSAAAASRFAVNNWLQAGLLTANIRQVSAVGGNSISVSGAALTISENDRIFLIGNTQPTVSGGSATYTTPDTIIRQRDDDAATIFTDSRVTSDSDGLIQFFSDPVLYDCIIQDGNQAAQGSIINLPAGAVEGVSTEFHSVFGATVTIHGALGVTGSATFDGVAVFGSTVTMNAAMGVTGTAVFGSTATFNAAIGVTGTAVFGSTLTANAGVVVVGNASFGSDLSIDDSLTVVGGFSTFGDSVSITGNISAGGGFRSYLTGWFVTNLAANISGEMIIGSEASRVPMPRAGSITALAVLAEVNITGGTASFQVQHNGAVVAGLSTFLNSIDGTTLTNTVTQAIETTPFAVGDYIDVAIQTTADFLPAGTAEVLATVEIET